jgi:membrane associated rhomboid family serine protease
MFITYLIIGVTVAISLWAFNNQEVVVKFKHWPYAEYRDKEYFRWITAGFLHGDMMHLLFNMLTLYFFGGMVEQWFTILFPGVGQLVYLFFYLVAIVAASLATYYRYRESPGFASIGASGAVSAVLFASILIQPTNSLYLMFIPIPIPGIVFGIFYIWYSSRASTRGGDGIDHVAHLYGALFGVLFLAVLKPVLVLSFIDQISAWVSSFGS